MLPLKVTFGGVLTGLFAAFFIAAVFWFVGKKNRVENKPANPQKPESPKPKSPEDKYISENPSTPKAKKAFLENLSKLMPFFTGVTEINVDKKGLTDAIIDINDADLISLWNQTIDKPEKWINIVNSFGVAADNRTEFVAMEKHLEMYSLIDDSPLEVGSRYSVLSACWILTESVNEKTTKRVVKKGIVEKVKNEEKAS